eukprot:g6831.t1
MDQAWALEAQGQRVIHLEVGQPDFDAPDVAIDAAVTALRAGNTKYTPNAGVPDLRGAVAEYYSGVIGAETAAEQVLVSGSGSMFAFASAFMATLAPGDEVLVPCPGFPNYESALRMIGAVPVPYPMPAANGWLPCASDVRARCTDRTRLLLLNSPSNPTGRVFPAALLQQLLGVARDRGLFVLSDEIYGDVHFGSAPAPAAAAAPVPPRAPAPAPSVLQCDYDPAATLVVSGVSKRFSMTGFRVGWLRAERPVIELAAKLQEPFVSCGSGAAQAAAAAALREPAGARAAVRMAGAYHRRRDVALAVLREYGLYAYAPEGAFYMMVAISGAAGGIARRDGTGGAGGGEFDDDPAAQFCAALLRERGVAVAPGSTFGATSRDHVRVALAASEEDVEEGVRRLCEFIVERQEGGSLPG